MTIQLIRGLIWYILLLSVPIVSPKEKWDMVLMSALMFMADKIMFDFLPLFYLLRRYPNISSLYSFLKYLVICTLIFQKDTMDLISGADMHKSCMNEYLYY